MSETISDEVYAELMLEEHRFFAAVRIAVDRRLDNANTWTMRCPICRDVMSVVRRSDRMTFGGWEPACIQVQCDTCAIGGEIAP